MAFYGVSSRIGKTCTVFSFLFVGKELIFSNTLEIPPIMVYYFVDHIRNLRENP